MNCQNFETVVGDLARGVPLEARARVEARAHEASCARCAARLADESALSSGLRALAASASELAAPPRVEADLLAAFRSRAAAAETPAAREEFPAARVVPLARPERAGRWGWVKTFGASAAAAAAAVALVVLVQPHRPATNGRAGSQPLTSPPREVAATPTARPALPPAIATPAVNGEARDRVEDQVAAAPRAANARRVPHARPAAVYQNAGGRAAQPAPAAGAGVEEIATDFIPLTQDARLAAAEGGQVVRVELPRTALQRFGLPMNVELTGGRVKADVMLGYDGVARAIRFVR